MTVKLPQKAGFAPTVQEWDALVRIAENLAAQLAQAQASAVETARIVGAQRDAARAEVARVTELAITERDSAAREIERLTAALENIAAEIDGSVGGVIARATLRQPGPALPTAPERLYGKYRISKADGSPTDQEAEYFVLRIDTDPAARAALNVYADYITFSAPEFCDDLRKWLASVPLKPAPAQGQE